MTPISHPGRLLKRELTARGLSANRLALDLGVPSGRITDIVNGRRAISADTAVRLGRYFGQCATSSGSTCRRNTRSPWSNASAALRSPAASRRPTPPDAYFSQAASRSMPSAMSASVPAKEKRMKAWPRDLVEIRARRRRHAGLGQHAPGELDRIVGEAADRGIDVEGAVDRQVLVEADRRQPLQQQAAVGGIAVADAVEFLASPRRRRSPPAARCPAPRCRGSARCARPGG